MGFTQTPTPALSAADWTDFISQVTRQRRGYIQMRLTDYFDPSAIPTIEEGSTFDLNGSLYTVDSDEAIGNWSSISNDTPIFIEIGGSPIAANWTTTAPTYDTAKGGWYNGNARVVGGAYKGTGGDCERKFLFHLLKFDQDGNVYFENDLHVEGDGYIEGSEEVGDSLQVVNDIESATGTIATFDATSISTGSLQTSGQVDFNADVDVNSTSTFTGTATFNGTILDKNGNEVLSLQAESVANTTNFGSGSSIYNVNTTHTFTNEVLGVAFITGFFYNNNLTRIDGINPQYKYTIGGTGNKTVTVTSLATLGSTSYTGYVTCYVTALTR